MTQPKITKPKEITVKGASVNISADSAPLLAALLLLFCLILIFCSGCESMKLDGFSVGATYLKTDISFNGQTTKVEGLMPTGLLNFKFD